MIMCDSCRGCRWAQLIKVKRIVSTYPDIPVISIKTQCCLKRQTFNNRGPGCSQNKGYEKMKIEIDDLNEYLMQHKDDIDFVVLQWTVNPNYAQVETNNYGIDRDGYKYRLYARFSFNVNDLEYSFAGSVEDAIKYTSNYNQWDGCDFTLEDGILMGEYDAYHGDAEEWPKEGSDLNCEE